MDYRAPLRDFEFVLFDLLDAESTWRDIPALADTTRDLVRAVLEEGGRIASEVMAPANGAGDREGCSWRDGAVTTPAAFKPAFRALADGGWFGVSGNPAHGGQGLPKMLTVALEEMFYGANTSLYLYGTLTVGAAICIDMHATPELKARYLPKLYAGAWTGAMALTEAHAGTDLGLLRTRAEPLPDGTYAITGTKIFITSGEHDLAENIVHLVLAKLPDAPGGTRGISLFLVPKFLSTPDGKLDQRNSLASASIEHKMGIRGSATSVMSYDRAVGYLIGAPNEGLAAMFTMMNYERLSVGIQGLGTAEAARQLAARYAAERLQGRSPVEESRSDGAADPLLVHPDVRRMLLLQRAFNEGGRAFAALVGRELDVAKYGVDDAARERAARLVGLLTPIAKAFLTDRGLDCCIAAQQVFGGHGYIVESGIEQLVRDVRISQIYEGTNGVQALDLVARKVLRDGGATVRELIGWLRDELPGMAAEHRSRVAEELERLERVTASVLTRAHGDPALPGAVSTDYLDLFALTVYAWLWGRMAAVAPDDAFGNGKRDTARFFFARLLPQSVGLEGSISAPSTAVMAPSDTSF